MTSSQRGRWPGWIWPAALIEAVAMTGMLVLALDIYAHKRVEGVGGTNVWGYRGEPARQLQPRELRVAVVGGTRAFGWGQPGSALATEIRRVIMLTTDRPGRELLPVSVVNLGQLGALPDSYPEVIDHFAYLRPDYICLYDDLGIRGARAAAPSAVFELTGYVPALPLVLREKGTAWRASHSVVGRAAGSALEWAGAGAAAADGAATNLLVSRRGGSPDADSVTADYAGSMMAAIESARRHARGVVVVASPAETAEQLRNLRAVRTRIQREIGPETWLRFVDLGTEPPLLDSAVRLDGWNYGSEGIALVADRVAAAVLSLRSQS